MANKIKFKRGLHQNLPILEVGEPAFTTDTKEFYIGTASGNVLVGVKVDDNTIKLNESNQIYVDEIAIAKVTNLATQLGLKVSTSTTVNNKALSGNITLYAGDVTIDNPLSDFNNMNIEESLDSLKNGLDGITIPTVPVISTDITTDGGSDVKTASPKAVKTYVDNKVATTYKASGSLASGGITNALLIAGNLGNVYNITNSFTTTADFIEGAGVTHPAGTNIVIAKVGEAYKFDVLAGFVDTSAFLTAVPKATNSALGGIKVGYTTSTPKHKVELDGSGNAFVDLTNLTIDGGEW